MCDWENLVVVPHLEAGVDVALAGVVYPYQVGRGVALKTWVEDGLQATWEVCFASTGTFCYHLHLKQIEEMRERINNLRKKMITTTHWQKILINNNNNKNLIMCHIIIKNDAPFGA